MILALVLALGATPWMRAAADPAADSSAVRRSSLAGRGIDAVGNFGSDVWLVVSSPARINGHGAKWLVAIAAASGVLYGYDQELRDASLRNGERAPWREIQEVGTFLEPAGFMPNSMIVSGTALVAGYAFGVEPLKEIPLQIIESHLIAGGLRNAAKLVIGRRRPNEHRGSHLFELNGGTSFPSGHTSVVFEIATILSHHLKSPVASVALYTMAGTVAVERVHSNQHWASDVFLSAITGTLIARTVVRRHEERGAAFHPVFSMSQGGVHAGVGARF